MLQCEEERGILSALAAQQRKKIMAIMKEIFFGMEVRKMKQKIIRALMLVCLLFAVGISANSQKAEALTKTQVKAKISSLNKEIKKLEKEKKREVAVEKKQRKGKKELFGTVISHNPFVMKNTLDGSYYWVESSGNIATMVTITGIYVNLTGKYRDYNGITCRVAKAAKVSNKSASLERKIKKKRKDLKNYQNSLKETIVFTQGSAEVTIGSPKKLPWHWKYSGKYNMAKWKSSNTSIAAVDSEGRVTGKQQGTVTISVTTSLSQKTAQCKVTVGNGTLGVSYSYEDEDTGEELEDVELTEGSAINTHIIGNQYHLYYTFDSKHIQHVDKYESSDESVATIDSSGWVQIVGAGETVITVSYKGVSVSFKVIVTPDIAFYYSDGDYGYTTIKENAVITMKKGEWLSLYAGYRTLGSFPANVNCKSSDESVATVTSKFNMEHNGGIRAVEPGTATITVECCNLVLSFKVTVEDTAGSGNDYDDGGYSGENDD